jgi:hypothetical protein
METNEDRSTPLTPTLEPLRLSGLRLFPFIPLALTKEKPAEFLEGNGDQ